MITWLASGSSTNVDFFFCLLSGSPFYRDDAGSASRALTKWSLSIRKSEKQAFIAPPQDQRQYVADVPMGR